MVGAGASGLVGKNDLSLYCTNDLRATGTGIVTVFSYAVIAGNAMGSHAQSSPKKKKPTYLQEYQKLKRKKW